MKWKNYLVIFALIILGAFIANIVGGITLIKFIEPSFEKTDDDKNPNNNSLIQNYSNFNDSKVINSKELKTNIDIEKYKTRVETKEILLPVGLPMNNYQGNIKNDYKTLYFGKQRWISEGKIVIKNLIRLNCLNKNSVIVDLGGGTGYYSLIFSQFAKKVFLIDVDSNILDEALQIIRYNTVFAKIKGAKNDYNNITPILSCNNTMLLTSESADCIFICAMHVLQQGTPDYSSYPNNKPVMWNKKKSIEKQNQIISLLENEQGEMIQNIYDTLKKDGKLIIIENMSGPGMGLRLNRQGMKKLLEKYNLFLIEDIKDLQLLNEKKDNIHFLVFQKK